MPPRVVRSKEPRFWLSPFSGDEIKSGEDRIRDLLVERSVYRLGPRTTGRKSIRAGDWICFYLSGKGIIAHARVASAPENKSDQDLMSRFYPLVFKVDSVSLYTHAPIVLNWATRSQLDAFNASKPGQVWGWFVTGTHSITRHDFDLITHKHLEGLLR